MFAPHKTLWMECQPAYRLSALPSGIELFGAVGLLQGRGAGSLTMAGGRGVPGPGSLVYEATGRLGPGVGQGRFTMSSPVFGTVSSARVDAEKPPATTLTGVVHQDVVYSEHPVIKVTVQLRDLVSMATDTATVWLEYVVAVVGDTSPAAAPEAADAAAVAAVPAPYTRRVRCGGYNRKAGLCTTDLSLPASFTAGITGNTLLRVECVAPFPAAAGRGRRDGTAAFELGVVPFVPAAAGAGASAANALYTVLPSRGLFAGEEFDLEVRSSFGVYLKVGEVLVTLGAGLALVGDSFATNGRGKELFVGAIDRSASVASASFSRSGNTPVGDQGGATGELLFVLRARVLAGAGAGANTTVALEGLRFKDGGENLLPLDSPGRVISRSSAVGEGQASVYFDEDAVVSVFAQTDGPTELLNTAVISGDPVAVPIVARAMWKRGRSEDVTHAATCATTDAAVLGVDAGCRAVLRGTELRGARTVAVTVTVLAFTLAAPFRVHYPWRVSLAPSHRTIKPVSGWMDEADPSCARLHYQPARLHASASFSDGVDHVFSGFDVTSMATFRSSRPDVAAVERVPGQGARIVATLPGTAEFSIVGAGGGTLATTSVAVANQSMANVLAVVGIDVHVVSALGEIEVDTSREYARGSEIAVRWQLPASPTLQYQGDSRTVLASAILSDRSLVELSPENGLVVTSLTPGALTAIGNRTLVVPHNPGAAVGDNVRVRWQPRGRCFAAGVGFPAFATLDVAVPVTPPQADRMVATVADGLLVPGGDLAAARGADFPVATQLRVELHFGATVKGGLESDSRIAYRATPGAPFAVDSRTGVVTASTAGEVGVGDVEIRVAGQNASATVTIEVARFHTLFIRAHPEPSYAGSGAVDVSQLNAIACSTPLRYQQARAEVFMRLTNGLVRRVSPGATSYSLTGRPPHGSDASAVLSVANHVLTAAGPGSVGVVAFFGGAASEIYAMRVSTDPVRIAAFQGLRLVKNRKTISSFSAGRGAFAQLDVGATFSDGRVLDTIFARPGEPLYGNVFAFSSALPAAISVDNTTGQAQLLANHHSTVGLSVSAPCVPGVTGLSKLDGQCYNKDTATFSKAGVKCGAQGARLCTVNELEGGVAANTGCGLDGAFVWTSDSCGAGSFLVTDGSFTGRMPECRKTSTQTASIRCCLDGGPGGGTNDDEANKDGGGSAPDGPAAAAVEEIAVAANLAPATAGDVDLGQSSGVAVSGAEQGRTIEIPVRCGERFPLQHPNVECYPPTVVFRRLFLLPILFWCTPH